MEEHSEVEDMFYTLRYEMEELVFNDSNKISKQFASRVLANYAKMEKEVISMRLTNFPSRGAIRNKNKR
ncbi:MAG: hypothetical protein ACTS80_01355 [Candidatus Hodgkinia cicadicola]